MTAAAQVDGGPSFGQVWQLGDRLAVVIYANQFDDDRGPRVHLSQVSNSAKPGGSFLAEVVDGQVVTEDGTWSRHSVLPTLRCVDANAARAARTFLAEQKIRDVFVSGYYVAAPLTPPTVLQFAGDALANGWAEDGECAGMIARLG